MRLSYLFPNRALKNDPEISALCEDSRRAETGALFFAHIGSRDNGTKYLGTAIMNGCVAIVVPQGTHFIDIPDDIVVLHSDNTRLELARCAALFYPHQPEHIVAVTGTSGKTSTSFFVQQFLNLSGRKAVSIGTIGIAGAMTRAGSLTTPEAPELHATLQEIASQNIQYVTMEASSQALDQHRMDHVRLHAAAFTNLSHDHLDYHGNPENYRAAKARLFGALLPAGGTAVLNADDTAFPDFMALAHTHGHTVISYGHKGTDLTLTHHVLSPAGQEVSLRFKEQDYTLTLNIAGAFQAGNVLAAIGLCLALGLDIENLIPLAPRLIAPPGRLQYVPGHPRGAAVYVDYAHKPDALENVLIGLQAHAPQNLICVFGCGGDRDATKRPMMGEIAARLATHVIITDDNPRTETPDHIRAQILIACPGARNIGDRSAAIHAAINMAQAGDIVVIAGKGHEQGQKFADRIDPFDDVTEAEAAMRDFSSSLSSPPLAANGQ